MSAPGIETVTDVHGNTVARVVCSFGCVEMGQDERGREVFTLAARGDEDDDLSATAFLTREQARTIRAMIGEFLGEA